MDLSTTAILTFSRRLSSVVGVASVPLRGGCCPDGTGGSSLIGGAPGGAPSAAASPAAACPTELRISFMLPVSDAIASATASSVDFGAAAAAGASVTLTASNSSVSFPRPPADSLIRSMSGVISIFSSTAPSFGNLPHTSSKASRSPSSMLR